MSISSATDQTSQQAGDTAGDLIARLEAATEGGRELDARIAVSLYGYTFHADTTPEHFVRGHFACWMGTPHESVCTNVSGWPHYTTSLDEALTLVPEGHDWSKQASKQAGTTKLAVHKLEGNCLIGVFHEATASTPALALCIAALKARTPAATPEHLDDSQTPMKQE